MGIKRSILQNIYGTARMPTLLYGGYGAYRAQGRFRYQRQWEPYRGYVDDRRKLPYNNVSLAAAVSNVGVLVLSRSAALGD